MSTLETGAPAPEIIGGGAIRRGLAAFSVLTVLGLGALFVFSGSREAEEVVRALSSGFFALAIASAVLDCILGGLRHWIFLRKLAPGTPLSLPIRADLVGRFTGAVTPSQTGGGPGQIFVLFRGGVPLPDVLSTLTLNLLATLVFFALAGGAATWMLGERLAGGLIGSFLLWGFIVMSCVTAFLLLCVIRPDLLAGLIGRGVARLEHRSSAWAKGLRRGGTALIDNAERFKESCARCVREWPLLPVVSLALTGALYLNKFTLAWFVMRGLGVAESYLLTVVAQAVLHVILFVAPTPGGSLIAEISTAALMSIVMPTSLLARFTLAQRLFMNYLPAALGALLLAIELRPRTPTVAVAGRAALACRSGLMTLPFVLPLLASASLTMGASAQVPPIRVPPAVTPVHERCRTRTECAAAFERLGIFVRQTLDRGILATTGPDSLAAFGEAVDSAGVMIRTDPDHPDGHYLAAVALGLRLEFSGTTEKVVLGNAAYERAAEALALDPEHAGAHHVLGRINGAAMRLPRWQRFIAKRVLGASSLRETSWERAESHFARAAELEPDNPLHWMELGVVYLDTGRPGLGLEALRKAAACERGGLNESRAVDRSARLVAELESSSDP